jgi:sugar/nucleoside kinase (ribokinase family)
MNAFAREQCASQLLAAEAQVRQMKAFIGLDGFVDEILHVVDKRETVEQYQRLSKISQFAERMAAAAGHSTNIELVSQLTKLGGNGPIMANAMASFGMQVTYLGLLGYPQIHPAFADFAKRAEVYSIAEPARTDALEFEDGKIMLGKTRALDEMNWENICAYFGRENFFSKICTANIVGCVNWTMLTKMNDIWSTMLQEICPGLTGSRRKLFVDLCDPEKRTHKDIMKMMELLVRFELYFDVILGLNEKEAREIGNHLGLAVNYNSPEGLVALALRIQENLPIMTIVVHPTAYALAVSQGKASMVSGPLTRKPLITTGAGDHFNAGFCLGKLLGFSDEGSVLVGVTTSGVYVRTGKSPALADLVDLLKNWPETRNYNS